MKQVLCMLLLCLATTAGRASPGPQPGAQPAKIPAPLDRPYPGELRVSVDATDVDRHIVHVKERLTGVGGEITLLYPQWLPGAHAPEGTLDRFAGLRISAASGALTWTRDTVDVFAFHVDAPAGVNNIDIEFDYLSPTSAKVGKLEMTPDLAILEWPGVVLYPAGYFARQIPVTASITLPQGWKFGSALEPATSAGATTEFKRVSLETLMDSPVYAGRYSERLDLDPNGKVPVHMNVFADRPELLTIQPEGLAAYRALVRQAHKLYGSHHYAHYDFLYSLSDQVEMNGLEHQQSSENGAHPESFTEWDKDAWERDLLPHEYTHSWNGKFRRPADLWTPNYNVPMQDSLLWVYEGQTQYWGLMLAARSGLWTKDQALGQLALTAAFYEVQSGRKWRPLQDTTNDEIINPRRPMAWRDWQRFEDYYNEGAMIWLDADTLIREQSNGRRSLDDFARSFFGIDDGSTTIVTYTFDDVLKALNAVQPYDWNKFLRSRLDTTGRPPFLDGIHRGGYSLVYTDTPTEYQKSRDASRKRANFWFSIGAEIDAKDGSLVSVIWDSPAFKASLTEGDTLLAINGTAYSEQVLKEAITGAKQNTAPIEIIAKSGARYFVAHVDYHAGLRYPRLQRDPSVPARLDDIVAPRP